MIGHCGVIETTNGTNISKLNEIIMDLGFIDYLKRIIIKKENRIDVVMSFLGLIGLVFLIPLSVYYIFRLFND